MVNGQTSKFVACEATATFSCVESKYLFLESRPNPTTIWAGRSGCYYCTFYITSHLAKLNPKEEFIDIMGVIKQMKQVTVNIKYSYSRVLE